MIFDEREKKIKKEKKEKRNEYEIIPVHQN